MTHDIGQGQWFMAGALDNMGCPRPLFMLCAAAAASKRSCLCATGTPIRNDPRVSPPLFRLRSQGGDMGRPILQENPLEGCLVEGTTIWH